MKRQLLFSTVLAGALMLPAANTASAAQRGGHSFNGGHAVGRTAPRVVEHGPRPGGRVVVRPYGFYRPAFGWGYYAYDPFWYGWGAPYAEVGVAPAAPATGGLRLEVKPETAQVFVDGAYAGVVDDFDGHFQHLDLTPGGHQIEIRAPGFETQTFNTFIQPDHTTDYKATMTPIEAER